MKHLFSSLLALLTLLALVVPARADIMWEPRDNQFYEMHRGACEYENRVYYANGAEGFVTVWEAPDGSLVRAQYENGVRLRVYFIYRDWGLIGHWEDGNETSGWIPMAELELVYDYISFEEEYADRITPYNGEFADYDGDAEVVNFYAYPGAPEMDDSIKNDTQWNVLGKLTGAEDGVSYIRSIFVDEDGRTWGFVGYMYGHRDSWFCLDEPDGADFPVRDVYQPGLTPARTPVLPAAGYVPYLLVAAVTAATLGLLLFFYGKRKKST